MRPSASRSKKGVGFLTAIKLIESLKLMLLVIFGIGLFLFLLSPKSINPDVEKEVLKDMYVRGLTGSTDCFAYEGTGDRVDQRTLDSTRLTEPILSACMGEPKNRDFSDWHSASVYLKQKDRYINSSEWVSPLLFEYTSLPVLINEGGTLREDTLILYLITI